MEKVIQRVCAGGVALIACTILVVASSQVGKKVEVKQKQDEIMSPMIAHQSKLPWLKTTEELKEEKSVAKEEAKRVATKEPEKEAETKQVEVEKEEAPVREFTLTYYVADCKGCSGITYTGIDVRDSVYHEGYRVLSVDPREIELGSVVEVDDGTNVFKAIAIDTGGAIKGRKLDMLVESVKEALELGVKKVKVKVIREGW